MEDGWIPGETLFPIEEAFNRSMIIKVLRANGHRKPLNPCILGLDRRAPIFEKTNTPIFEQLYESVRNGTEIRKPLEFNGRSTLPKS
ncbi:hypothetical protein EV424DRAFT_1574164 [Suillus variegatus]|nr:hypothetical protein EV424DRAFT_1574164 [Suillus variegatus]